LTEAALGIEKSAIQVEAGSGHRAYFEECPLLGDEPPFSLAFRTASAKGSAARHEARWLESGAAQLAASGLWPPAVARYRWRFLPR
jgi:hypothetical protein